MEPTHDPKEMYEHMTSSIGGVMDMLNKSMNKIQESVPIETRPVKINGFDCMLQRFDTRVVVMFADKKQPEIYFDEFGKGEQNFLDVIYGLQTELDYYKKPWYKKLW